MGKCDEMGNGKQIKSSKPCFQIQTSVNSTAVKQSARASWNAINEDSTDQTLRTLNYVLGFQYEGLIWPSLGRSLAFPYVYLCIQVPEIARRTEKDWFQRNLTTESVLGKDSDGCSRQ